MVGEKARHISKEKKKEAILALKNIRDKKKERMSAFKNIVGMFRGKKPEDATQDQVQGHEAGSAMKDQVQAQEVGSATKD